MVYRLIMFYLVRSEASYQSFTGSIYGLVCFYNKCALIKVTPKVYSDGITINFAMQTSTVFLKHISSTNQ